MYCPLNLKRGAKFCEFKDYKFLLNRIKIAKLNLFLGIHPLWGLGGKFNILIIIYFIKKF